MLITQIDSKFKNEREVLKNIFFIVVSIWSRKFFAFYSLCEAENFSIQPANENTLFDSYVTK